MPDPEALAMVAISDALSSLDPESCSRAIRWAAEKYGVTLPPLFSGGNGIAAPPRALVGVPEVDAQEHPAITDVPRSVVQAIVLPEFEHFADLFAVVDPTDEMEKALTAAYWTQVVQGRTDWDSASLNRELRDVGHKIASINKALDKAIEKKPQLVVQLRKAGGSRQARRTHKLTTEGVKYVRTRIEQAG